MQMTFLAPVPWEADAFYAQPGLAERGMTLDHWPVGTGPYMVTEFVKDRRHRDGAQPRTTAASRTPAKARPATRSRAARRLRQADAVRRQASSHVERETVPLQRQVPCRATTTCEVFERTDTGHGLSWWTTHDSESVRADYERKGFKLPAVSDVNS